jgi:hypothetical protein
MSPSYCDKKIQFKILLVLFSECKLTGFFEMFVKSQLGTCLEQVVKLTTMVVEHVASLPLSPLLLPHVPPHAEWDS